MNPFRCCCEGSGGTLVNVDATSVATATVSGNANANGGLLVLTETREDAGLDITANIVTNNIGGNHVVIDAAAYAEQGPSGTLARISPVLELLKNGSVVTTSDSAYARQATGDTGGSNDFTYTDYDPDVGDTWQLRAQRGSNQNDVLAIDMGHFSVRVVERKQVYGQA